MILAIDMSSHTASLALRRAGRALASHTWTQSDHPHPHLFAVLPDFLREARVEPEALSQIVVGVGPGSFSGIRAALGAANGLALPGRVPVHGLCSAAAIAWQLLREKTGLQGEIVIIGDARRGRCWLSRYAVVSSGVAEPLRLSPSPLVLLPTEALAAVVPSGACVATADWDRLADVLRGAAPHTANLIATPTWPQAAHLAELAERHAELGIPLLPPQPLYLHPPVESKPA